MNSFILFESGIDSIILYKDLSSYLNDEGQTLIDRNNDSTAVTRIDYEHKGNMKALIEYEKDKKAPRRLQIDDNIYYIYLDDIDRLEADSRVVYTDENQYLYRFFSSSNISVGFDDRYIYLFEYIKEEKVLNIITINEYRGIEPFDEEWFDGMDIKFHIEEVGAVNPEEYRVVFKFEKGYRSFSGETYINYDQYLAISDIYRVMKFF